MLTYSEFVTELLAELRPTGSPLPAATEELAVVGLDSFDVICAVDWIEARASSVYRETSARVPDRIDRVGDLYSYYCALLADVAT